MLKNHPNVNERRVPRMSAKKEDRDREACKERGVRAIWKDGRGRKIPKETEDSAFEVLEQRKKTLWQGDVVEHYAHRRQQREASQRNDQEPDRRSWRIWLILTKCWIYFVWIHGINQWIKSTKMEMHKLLNTREVNKNSNWYFKKKS